jgi:hypothetical protein
MPVFQAVLTGLAAFGGAKGALPREKARRERLGLYPGAAQMVGHRCIFHLPTLRAAKAVPLRPGEPPKTKKRPEAGASGLFWVGRLASAARSGGAYNQMPTAVLATRRMS